MLLALDQLDAVVDQVGVEVLDLLLGELDFLEAGDDLVVGQEALLDAVLNEFLQLFDVRKGNVDGEHPAGLSVVGTGEPRTWKSRHECPLPLPIGRRSIHPKHTNQEQIFYIR